MKGTIIRGAPLVLIRFGATSFMWCVPPPKCIYIWCACFARSRTICIVPVTWVSNASIVPNQFLLLVNGMRTRRNANHWR
ncbi:hypothetical protein PF008_g30899 [Phytophthora fragariae]|uniref:Uncharacterized protein n=1 Tax=Phytophthora fragariae TaxID=53985 RepID=A0A6G0Q484_9STRA|nr:hypothetical protein PF008_g30899 [Phytophthora fragariae]